MIKPPPLLHVLGQPAEVLAQPIGTGVEILQDHGVEAGQMHGEQLVHRKGDQGELVRRGTHVAPMGAENEEGHDVDRGVRLEPGAQGPNIVGGAPGDVEQPYAVPGHIHREKTMVVFGDGVAIG